MSNQVYTVVGLGKTGLSCIQYLTEQNATVFAVDTRDHPPNLDQAEKLIPKENIRVGKIDTTFLDQSDIIVLSPGLSRNEPELQAQIKKNKPVIGDVELFCRCAKAPIVAITGSNGKSSVTTLVGEMAKCAGKNVKVGGNLGIPVLDLYESPEPDLYVLELSSFQLESTFSLQAEVAVVLNITPDHLDLHGTFENYVNAKMRIYNGCKNVVINLDEELWYSTSGHPGPQANEMSTNSTSGHPGLQANEMSTNSTSRHPGLQANEISMKLIRDLPGKAVTFNTDSRVRGNDEPDFAIKQRKIMFKNKPVLSLDELKIKGAHQYSNVLAALAIGTAINLPMYAMCEAIKSFEGLPHRCQWVAEKNSVSWFNDSKATNVGAALASIVSIAEETSGKIVLLAGGQAKGADFLPLKKVASQLRAVILFGEDEALLKDVFDQNAPTYSVEDLSGAIMQAKDVAQPGDAVLLAPACASFDMFKNFEHRGECFQELVGKLV